jgi:ABC-2 type transport system permease protein
MAAMLRRISSIARTDLRIELRDRSTWLFYLGLPLLFTAILGVATGSSPSPLRLVVVDADQSAVSRALISNLDAQHGLATETVDAASPDATSGAPLLTIASGFGADLLAGNVPTLGLANLTSDANGVVVRQSVGSAVDEVAAAATAARIATQAASQIRPFGSASAQAAYLASALDLAQPLIAAPAAVTRAETASAADVPSSGFSESSPGELVTWTLITLLGVSEVFISERLWGTLRRLLVTPTSRATIVIGKITGRYMLGLLQMALLIGVGAAVFGVSWGRSPVALVLVVLAFALAAVALGVLLASVARTRAQATQLTILASMLLASLGGAWFPLDITPAAFRAIAQVLPTTWAMSGFNDVILRGAGPLTVLPAVAVLCGFAALFFALAVRRLRFD